MRVLVVDDEAAVRHLVDRALTRRGHHVISAPNPYEADALLLDYPAPLDVALIDFTLPGMNGIAYGEELARTHTSTRIIIMTGWTSADDIAGAQRWSPLLLKPFRLEALIEIVESPGGPGRSESQ